MTVREIPIIVVRDCGSDDQVLYIVLCVATTENDKIYILVEDLEKSN